MAVEWREQPRPARLFFALWPDDALRDRIAAYRPSTGRAVAPENWHITLVFLGPVGPAQRQVLEQAADAVRAPRFRLQLDRFGHWRRSGITWLGIGHTPPALMGLHEQLGLAATRAGLVIETRPYRPHLTLARQAPAVPGHAIDAIDWDARDFCLVESITRSSGAQYIVRRRWPLQEAPAGD